MAGELLMPNVSSNEADDPPAALLEVNDGVYLNDLQEGTVLEIETRNHHYTIVNRTKGEALISGHPVYCPDPVAARIEGSAWYGFVLKSGFIGLGMCLAFQLPTQRRIRTSPIVQIRTIQRLAF